MSVHHTMRPEDEVLNRDSLSKSGLASEMDLTNNAPPTNKTTLGASTPENRLPKLQRTAGVNVKKVIARTLPHASSSSLNSLNSQMASPKPDTPDPENAEQGTRPSDDGRQSQNSLFHQVHSWLRNERARVITRREKASDKGHSSETSDLANAGCQVDDTELALDQLERILAQFSSSREALRPRGAMTPKQRIALKGLRRGSHSESDYTDSESAVPSTDVILDNSKTLLYSGGEADSDADSSNIPISAKDREHWLKFKAEILRLAHTLGIKGWRRVSLDSGGELEVVRLSGALTNAVYVVSPPKNLPIAQKSEASLPSLPRKPPPKLLLRVYGPQVEHLIDRERELQILRRLGKKNIGPRVLGTFKNGRFEQYFNAKPLTCHELRIPETSKQISKRMRELHDGIDLLPEEREAGPTLWQNWDKWVARCEKVTTWLDQETLSEQNDLKAVNQTWRSRGFVCCVPWSDFRAMVDRYRKWLCDQFGGEDDIANRMVFAHNDTQYGNLLRLQPSEESPLLLPANEHKQLIVIDFEYASANMRAVEFANHFTEWCYNYHDTDRPWACRTGWYPTIEEQERFIRAYLKHRPAFMPSTPASSVPHSQPATHAPTPLTQPAYISSPRVHPFSLDSHVPSLTPSLSDLESRDPAVEAEIKKLLYETRLWRVANSIQWVAWGIVQAHVPGMEKALTQDHDGPAGDGGLATAAAPPERPSLADPQSDTSQSSLDPEQVKQEVAAEEAADEFDYLAYAQDRALFFWSDLLALGFIKEEELPAEMLQHIKKRLINY